MKSSFEYRIKSRVFGAIARTSRGREQLTPEGLRSWTRPWLETPDPSAWWIERDAGVALFRPHAQDDANGLGTQSALAICGAVRYPKHLRASEEPATDILNLILEQDTSAIRNLRGQFVIACWDGRRRRLLLARDHLGQQALFIRTEADLIIFCSELAPLLRPAHAGCEMDFESAYWYLAFGMPPPGRTLARGVERVPAAHVVSWEPSSVPVTLRYWSPLSADAPRTASPEVADAIGQTLDRAIIESYSADEPHGILLSGGTDSSYLATTLASIEGSRLTAFTSAFEEHLGINDDVGYAASVASGLGIPHKVVPLHAEKALELLDQIFAIADEPYAAWASLTHYQLLTAARESGIDCMLSGLGADEVFGGYDHFHRYYVRFLEYCEQLPAPEGGDGFESLLSSDDLQARQALYPGIARFFEDYSLREALEQPYRDWEYVSHLRTFYRECRRLKPEAQVIEMMVAHECQHRIPDLLFANFEAISRHIGVTVSYPCIDPDVVRLATGLDVLSRYRTPAGQWSPHLHELQPGFKHALMLVYERKLPEMILKRPIKAFTAPFGSWLADDRFSQSVLSRLRRSRFWDRRMIRREWLDHVLDRILPSAEESRRTFQLWAILTLVSWYDRFVDPPAST